MANTYSQIYLHIVFAVKYRTALLQPQWQNRLFAYLGGVADRLGHKLLAAGGVYDHLHLLVSMSTSGDVAKLVQSMKAGSTGWIRDNKLCRDNFKWQAGYGCFSCSTTNLLQVKNYITNQAIHHQKVAFLDEYKDMLDRSGIEYSEQYLFHPPQ